MPALEAPPTDGFVRAAAEPRSFDELPDEEPHRSRAP
jgi:hypothetical protein